MAKPNAAITIQQLAKIKTYDVYLYETLVQLVTAHNAINLRVSKLEGKS